MVDFIHRPYEKGETIAAVATPPGEGGIAIIRICGDEALAVGDRVFSKKISSLPSHTVHHGFVLDGKERIDEALVLVMRAPCTYTGEETVEIQCHGGHIAAGRVLDVVLKNGARPAQPGEFTFCAFMNGKLDLAQAEAVQELIGAQSEAGFAVAQNHLEGGLSKEVRAFQKEVTRIAAILEAWVDFPEEGLEFASQEEMLADLHALQQKIRHLLDTFDEGQKLTHGIALALIGPPNAGKSSLMNALLRKERAIVTPIAGTTRDLVQEEFLLDGTLFHLTDTAGIRETDEVIEQEGIRRSHEAKERADIILLVLDVTQEVVHFDVNPEKTLLVWNKCDLESVQKELPFTSVRVSAKTGEGLSELKEALLAKVQKKKLTVKDVLLTSRRHFVALQRAHEALERLSTGLQNALSPEFLNVDARAALKDLGEIIGTNVGEDILSEIFSTFCVGK